MNGIFTIIELTKKECKYTVKSIFFFIFIVLLSVSCYMEFHGKIQYLPIKSQSDLVNYNDKSGQTFIIENPTDLQKRNSIRSILEDKSNSSINRNEDYTKLLDKINELSFDEIISESTKVINKDKVGLEIYNQICTILESPQNFIQADLKTSKELMERKVKEEDLYSRFVKNFASVSSMIAMLYIIIIFAFTLEKDKRDNINEVIRTTSIRPHEYILGNYLGKIIPIAISYLVISVIFFVTAYYKYKASGLEVSNLLLGVKYIITWSFVSFFFVSSFVVLVSLLIYDSIATGALCVLLNVFLSGKLNPLYNYQIKYSYFEGSLISTNSLIAYNRVAFLIGGFLCLILSCITWGRIKYLRNGGIYDGTRKFIKNKLKNLPVK
ncbi:hypothetical protein JHL18_02650 [Clostridium sp. YIM B02505]|uniref:ABC-2 type transporter transmembrane domain-containing protein n=1 Tax=Clostridium yunnanense TaxID=2800325 RepID=A0ABS1EJM2_9CLOT|nr:ABC transporter permease [Clostridium yunnanense]MBK1809545.1 hypothetical protein [Clostridium yunnanense]